jgi:arylsulfatase A
MNTQHWSKLLLVLLCWPHLVMAAQQKISRPNVVFILMDDLGWADVGCYGSTFYKTPNIDRLAGQGMRFTDAYAAAPVCSPTRASILTGKYPARLHLTDWLPGLPNRPNRMLLHPEFNQELPIQELVLPEVLKKLGYTSAAIGKWHLGGEGFLPQNQSFDVNIGGTSAGSPPSYFYPYTAKAISLPGLEKGNDGEYLTDRLTAEAERFIEQHQSKPFFLYLSHYAVHIPLGARAELVKKYEGSARGQNAQTNAVYAAMIESMDASVGRILQKLEQLGLTDNTVVVFTSDNGGLSVKEGPKTPATSNAPLRAGKGYLYEGGIREPMIIRWPGIVQPGSVCTVPVSSIDFFPTILELAGTDPKVYPQVDGVSLLSLLKGRSGFSRTNLFWHYPHYSNQGGKPGGAIRSGDFKLIEFYEDGRWELYNLKEDLSEQHNLAESMPKKAAELQAKLDAWRRTTQAQMMLPNPEYRAQATKGKDNSNP